jgi:hypothetical protein
MRTLLEEYGEFVVVAIMCVSLIFGLAEIMEWTCEGSFLLGNYFVN